MTEPAPVPPADNEGTEGLPPEQAPPEPADVPADVPAGDSKRRKPFGVGTIEGN